MVMPYANFDDVHSLQAVYNNCLQQDADMDCLEFIGEKLLIAGFDPEEDDETDSRHPNQPIHGANMVQIQSGAINRPQVTEISLEQPVVIRKLIPVTNTTLLASEFHPGIFHPPIFS